MLYCPPTPPPPASTASASGGPRSGPLGSGGKSHGRKRGAGPRRPAGRPHSPGRGRDRLSPSGGPFPGAQCQEGGSPRPVLGWMPPSACRPPPPTLAAFGGPRDPQLPPLLTSWTCWVTHVQNPQQRAWSPSGPRGGPGARGWGLTHSCPRRHDEAETLRNRGRKPDAASSTSAAGHARGVGGIARSGCDPPLAWVRRRHTFPLCNTFKLSRANRLRMAESVSEATGDTKSLWVAAGRF